MEQQPFQNPGYYPPYAAEQIQKQEDRAERRNLTRIGVAFFVYLIAVSLLQTALVWGGSTFFPALYHADWFQWILHLVPSYVIGFPLFLCLVAGMPKKKPEKKKMGFAGWIGFLAVSFFLMTVGGLISSYLTDLLETVKGSPITDSITQQIDDFSPLMNLVVLVIGAPIFEELMFRKLLIDRLLPYSEAFAVLTGGLLFGLVHGNFYQFFYATLLGMLFSLVYIRTGKLRYTIGMHMIINFTGSIIADFLRDSMSETLEPTGSVDLWGMLGGVYSMAMYVLAGCGLVLLILGFKKLLLSTEGKPNFSFARQLKVGWLNVGMLMILSLCLLMFVSSVFFV